MLVYALSRGIDAGIGSLVAERDISSIKRIFWEFTSLRLFLGATICSDIYFMINPFIQLWLGTAYEMEKFSMVIMATIFFVQMSRTCDVFLSAFGLFHDTWAPVAELALNVGLSVILGSYWGLSGILMGVLISQILIVVFWKAFFLYKNAFSCEFSEWIVSYLKKLLKLAFVFILCVLLTEYFFDLTVRSYADWLLMSIIRTVLYSGFAFLLLFFTDRDFNRVSKKIIRIKGIKKA